MSVWAYLGIGILCVTAFVLVLSVLYILCTTWIAGLFSRQNTGKYLNKLESALPGTNCGGCGCQTCKAYAYDVFSCRKDTDRCVEGGPAVKEALDTIMEQFQNTLPDEDEKPEATPNFDELN